MILTLEPLQILRRHVVDQPDAVLRAAEEVSGLVHGRRVDGEDDRAAVPRTDPPRGLGVGREVHVMARHAEQALPRDAVRGAVARAVVEDGGGSTGSSCRSMSTLWPWLARIKVPVASNAKRFLSFHATTSLPRRLLAPPADAGLTR